MYKLVRKNQRSGSKLPPVNKKPPPGYTVMYIGGCFRGLMGRIQVCVGRSRTEVINDLWEFYVCKR